MNKRVSVVCTLLFGWAFLSYAFLYQRLRLNPQVLAGLESSSFAAVNDGDDDGFRLNPPRKKSEPVAVPSPSQPNQDYHNDNITASRYSSIAPVRSIHTNKGRSSINNVTITAPPTSKLCKEEDVLDFSKNGRHYECLKDQSAAKKSRDHYEAHHHNLPKTEILLLNQRIGSVTRICEGDIINNHNYDNDENLLSRCVLPTGNTTNNINSPMPLRTKFWMKHPSFQGQSIILYYSSHTKNAIALLGLDSSTKMWKRLVDVSLSFQPSVCASYHSPSIFVDDQQKRFYMYVHGHHCKPRPKQRKGMKDFQPTLLYISEDGVSWQLQQRFMEKPPYLFWDLFYLTTPVLHVQDGHYYAMTRVRDGSSVILCRATSLEGPFQVGPMLGRSLRHFDMFYINDHMYLLFSMMGDRPERILLGSIDTTLSTDWNDWKLLPGPRILQPDYWYEHGNAPVATSMEGVARSRHRISDPRLLLDEDLDEVAKGKISGLLFYSVQGEKAIATARISIDLASYHNVTSYRDHGKIRPEVFRSTSLAQDDELRENGTMSTKLNVTDLLVTGVGRIGTTSMCTLLRKLGILVSHDNNVDCGPYPGPDGAVSWYDAFKPFSNGRRYKYVIHMVRDPIKTINSRIVKCERFKTNQKHVIRMVKNYELYSDDESCPSFALKHWVRRNSFVESHASWRVQTESFFSDQLSVWELCMAAGFGDRCPELSVIDSQLKNKTTNLNSLYSGATFSKEQERLNYKTARNDTDLHSWESLANSVGQQNHKYIQIAQTMAHRYGYDVTNEFIPSDHYCKFTGRGGQSNDYWDCFVTEALAE